MADIFGTRFEISLWPSDTDDFSRTQMNTSHTRIEDLGAIFRQGPLGSRGLATRWTKSFFYDETNDVLYFSDGTAWNKLTDFGSAGSITKVDPEVAKAAGSADQAARIDHQHDTQPWGTAPVAVGTSATGGSVDEFARIDHRHILGTDSVIAGTIADGAINSPLLFTSEVVETAALDSEAVTREKISIDQRIPVGAIMPYVGATAPTGWLLCDGNPHAKASYPALWAVLSTQNYGSSGDNFNTPDLLDRMPRGAATAITTLGSKVGTDTVTIAAANLPAHKHSVGTLGVNTHDSHVHLLNGVNAEASSNSNADHYHGVSAVGGSLNNGTVARFFGTQFLIFGGGDDPYQLMPPGWGGRPNNAGVYESGATLVDTAITVNAHNTGNASAGIAHGHSLSGSTAGVTAPALTHTMTPGGLTGDPSTATGTLLSVIPKTQTVNYIIKT